MKDCLNLPHKLSPARPQAFQLPRIEGSESMKKHCPKDLEDYSINRISPVSFAPAMQSTRRSFLGRAIAVAAAAGSTFGLEAEQAVNPKLPSRDAGSNLLDVLRAPDKVVVYSNMNDPISLARSQTSWRNNGVEVRTEAGPQEMAVSVSAPVLPIRYIHLRWSLPVPINLQVLGDQWERSYGDLGWRNIIPERVMPWYFATYDGHSCNGYGVKTGANSLCFWQLDPQGVSLWLNLSNGGAGVQLGERILTAATIVRRKGKDEEDITNALRSFCHQMSSQPALPFQPLYGTNDWYYAYGNNTAKQIIDDTDFIAGLSSGNTIRPFSVIDMGWAIGSPKFPSMPELASQIRRREVRPGIWIRPLQAPVHANPTLLLSDRRFGEKKNRATELAYDPTIPEAQEKILEKVTQVIDWNFELVKHDFSTYDLLGRWGFEMGAEPTTPGWSLHDRSRTNAEVILDLYQRIRERCGKDTLIAGCNTIGHLAQGYFNAQRTGDDTSGRVWERTRRMGVNTLAFRLPQHQAFFIQDADCVGISPAIPWELNRQWLDLLAQSGTSLFISPGEGSRTPEHARAIKEAFQLAASGGGAATPADLLQESTPQKWTAHRGSGSPSNHGLEYDWSTGTGASPFMV
jgi:alpha-galactosidase